MCRSISARRRPGAAAIARGCSRRERRTNAGRRPPRDGEAGSRRSSFVGWGCWTSFLPPSTRWCPASHGRTENPRDILDLTSAALIIAAFKIPDNGPAMSANGMVLPVSAMARTRRALNSSAHCASQQRPVREMSKWVRSVTLSARQPLPLVPHVWTAPSWQGLFSRLQNWSVRPCVRPFSAVHMTAGHNALRVWTAPSWQELFSRLQNWSVRPCVRPFSAVHMTAGHNALRGSGPDRKPAFDNAWG